ncbi:MAG: Helix-turn-helix domain [Dehalococcoidia bacterium]|nr:Helix-turn-helix domain [Dehalococcoidia bacterium]
MQKLSGRWLRFHNNQAKLTGNGVTILRERFGWTLVDLSLRTGVTVNDLDSLENGYQPIIRLETLSRVANAFGFRLRARWADLSDELLRFFESQQRPMP